MTNNITADRPTQRAADFNERAFRAARVWSNKELARFAGSYEGAVINVSAWQDQDKQGACYRDYFCQADRYDITNFGGSQGALQHAPNEIYLDLEQELAESMRGSYDVVFNHTTLEHVWDFQAAFRTLAALTRDTLILVVPWIQPLHSDYGDYWRFSPQAVPRMMQACGLTPIYLSWNEAPRTSVYIFAIGSRSPLKWVAREAAFGTVPTDLILPENLAGRYLFTT